MEWNCGNDIAEIEKKNGNCGNAITENGRKKKQWLPKSHVRNFKKSATSIIFLQHFHNKSQVISYYQLKFEFNTEITFLIQQ